ncbi:MAG: NADH-quinone oxidoreductase subunit L, partial [Planctomycetes bacterium]|nr:NADH-quinone oxidoreductase subunit L [Planctomycetota bacterium]
EYADHIHNSATLYAFSAAMGGLMLAIAFYGMRWLNPADVRSQFSRLYRLLWNKWWFDEIYDALFVRPAHFLASMTATIDKKVIDGVVHCCAKVTLWISKIDDAIDRFGVDWLVNAIGNTAYSLGLTLRGVQTGRIRQYVMFVIVGTVALFVIISFAVAK